MRIVGIIGLVGVGVTSLAVSVADKRVVHISYGKSSALKNDLIELLLSGCDNVQESDRTLSIRCREALQDLDKFKGDRSFGLEELVKDDEDLKVDDVDDDYLLIKHSKSPMVTITEDDGEDKAEGNLNPPLPPSNKRRRWGLGFGLVALYAHLNF